MKKYIYKVLFFLNFTISWSQSNNNLNELFKVNLLSLILFIVMVILIIVSLTLWRALKKVQSKDTSSQNTKNQKNLKSFNPLLLSSLNLNFHQLSDILNKCKILGLEIDEVTGRKNCSLNVAEIVYRISKFSGFNEESCQFYFCIALVYDAGFLNIDKEILLSSQISEEQFNKIKIHTSLAENYYDFIPDQWRPFFIQAAEKHHENLDGTGYPNRLENDKIPYIARVIRVAESYEAMISVREYRKICTKEAALEYLFTQNSIFDQKILEALEQVI